MHFPFQIPGPDFRVRQVRSWVFERFAGSFDEMTDLPATLRDDLRARYGRVRPEPDVVQAADGGDTIKALFPGGYEAVAMRYPGRRTVCISSQAGCGLGCTFCATGQMGLIRNLTPFEIVAQVLWAGEALGERPSNVVFMGMGEPLANFDNVVAALRMLNDDVGISARKLTVSTVGLVERIRDLARIDLPVRLALSLHAPDDETRSQLVPLNKRWPIEDCLSALAEFRRAHGRRVSIEYTLIAGVNDNTWQAIKLAELVKGTDIHINLIPLNPTPGYLVPASLRVDQFHAEVVAAGANATIRDTRGREIDAACGQLATERASAR